jgi:hypothetical protein
MKELVSLLAHLLATLVTLVGPGGVKAVVAQNLLLKHQLLSATSHFGRARKSPGAGEAQVETAHQDSVGNTVAALSIM